MRLPDDLVDDGRRVTIGHVNSLPAVSLHFFGALRIFVRPPLYFLPTNEDPVRLRKFSTLIAATCTIASLVRGAGTITATYFPASVAPNGGTGTTGYPYAVYVQIQGWTEGAGGTAYLKIYYNTNNEYMWASPNWSNATAYSSSNQPVVSIDASGNWRGWIYAKHNQSLGTTPKVRAAKFGSTGTNLTTTQSLSLTVLDLSLTGTGGWINMNSSSVANKGILAYAGGAVVGSYRTEENGINEGYGYASGGFKIAVPVGFIDSLVTVNDDGSRDGAFVGPWYISAGQETDASLSGSTAGKGTASLTPPAIGGGIPGTITCVLRGDSTATITTASLVVPGSWIWSHTAADVYATAPGSPLVALHGDTIAVSGLLVGGADQLQLSVSSITPPDTTATFTFRVLTGIVPDTLSPIQSQPTVFVYSIPRPISYVKQNDANGVPVHNGQMVTVRGIVTVANEFGSPTYIQDLTGGLAIYAQAFSASVQPGDEVLVSGLVQPFNGLTELVTPPFYRTLSTGNQVDPQVVTALDIASDGTGGVEQYEGLLVRLNAVTVVGSGTWTGETNYPVADATGTTELRIDKETNLAGQPIPGSSFDLIGVVGQYIGSSPYIGGYQIMPRSTADILSSGPIFTTAPAESVIAATELTIAWKTLHPGTTRIRYGATPSYELGLTGDDTPATDHLVTLTGLTPATVYYIGAFSSSGPDTSWASPLIASTSSPAPCTGEMNVYFNKSIDASVASSDTALGSQDLVTRIVGRINNARRSVDAALYSLSSSQGDAVASALIAARSRGLRVRVICEHDNRNSVAFSTLTGSGVPLIDDAFDQVNAGAGLMHNKFFVIDATDGAPDSAWVWTGSWNPTFEGTVNDYQNSIEIQDQALARAYTIEFNEMWGSSGTTPVQAQSRFGARKTDNTPHRFVIGGRRVASYFSPSDRTTSHILSAIRGARYSVNFALLTFTRNDLGSAIVDRMVAGVATRGVMDNNTDTGTEYPYLLGSGVDVHLKTGTGLLHHKYAVIDAEHPAADPVTITGSHNWSTSAEYDNNENTVIIRDPLIANLYLQEFSARYHQFGGTDSTLNAVAGDRQRVPAAYALDQNYPNPFNPSTSVGFDLPASGDVRLSVIDLLGREVAVLVNGWKVAGHYEAGFDARGLASGVYFCRLAAGRFVQTRKMMLLR